MLMKNCRYEPIHLAMNNNNNNNYYYYYYSILQRCRVAGQVILFLSLWTCFIKMEMRFMS
jgi:hypothetical protein